jgi:hypothetical protein
MITYAYSMQKFIKKSWFKLTFNPRNHIIGPLFVFTCLYTDKQKTRALFDVIIKEPRNRVTILEILKKYVCDTDKTMKINIMSQV